MKAVHHGGRVPGTTGRRRAPGTAGCWPSPRTTATASRWRDPATGEPHTAHTLNPVPFHLIHPDFRGQKLRPGILADIAPTLLQVMGLPKPSEMNRLGLFP